MGVPEGLQFEAVIELFLNLAELGLSGFAPNAGLVEIAEDRDRLHVASVGGPGATNARGARPEQKDGKGKGDDELHVKLGEQQVEGGGRRRGGAGSGERQVTERVGRREGVWFPKDSPLSTFGTAREGLHLLACTTRATRGVAELCTTCAQAVRVRGERVGQRGNRERGVCVCACVHAEQRGGDWTPRARREQEVRRERMSQRGKPWERRTRNHVYARAASMAPARLGV